MGGCYLDGQIIGWLNCCKCSRFSIPVRYGCEREGMDGGGMVMRLPRGNPA